MNRVFTMKAFRNRQRMLTDVILEKQLQINKGLLNLLSVIELKAKRHK